MLRVNFLLLRGNSLPSLPPTKDNLPPTKDDEKIVKKYITCIKNKSSGNIEKSEKRKRSVS